MGFPNIGSCFAPVAVSCFFARVATLKVFALTATLSCLLIVPPARADEDADDLDNGDRIAAVEVIEGRTNVRIRPGDRVRFGITVAPAEPHRYVVESIVRAKVMAIGGLVELHTSLRQSQVELETLAAAIGAQGPIIERIGEMQSQGLAVDYVQLHRERQSLRELMGRRLTVELRIRQLREQAIHDWGEPLGRALGGDRDPLVTDLVARRRYLLITEAPATDDGDILASTVMIEPSGKRGGATPAELLGPAVAAYGARGRSYFLVAARSDLRTGMRVRVSFRNNRNTIEGFLVPRRAVVWYAGSQWVYVRGEADRLERRRVAATKFLGDQVFLEDGIQPGDEVVVTGAPTLLGEEFRWSIPDEDDD